MGLAAYWIGPMWPLSRPNAAFCGVYKGHPLASVPGASLDFPDAWPCAWVGVAGAQEGRSGVPVPSTPIVRDNVQKSTTKSDFAEPAADGNESMRLRMSQSLQKPLTRRLSRSEALRSGDLSPLKRGEVRALRLSCSSTNLQKPPPLPALAGRGRRRLTRFASVVTAGEGSSVFPTPQSIATEHVKGRRPG